VETQGGIKAAILGFGNGLGRGGREVFFIGRTSCEIPVLRKLPQVVHHGQVSAWRIMKDRCGRPV